MSDTDITRHGEFRTRKRRGINKKGVARELDRVLENGMRIGDTTGQLRKYLDHLHDVHRAGSDYIVTPEGIHVITDSKLITVLTIPANLRGTLMSQWKRKKKEIAEVERNEGTVLVRDCLE